MKKNAIYFLVAIAAVIVMIMLAPKGSDSLFSTAGGGLSLKDLNRKDTVTHSVSLTMNVNQTTEQSLVQPMLSANYFKRHNGFFVGASAVGAVSNQYGICCPVLFVNTGVDFNRFQIEYRAGNFGRNAITTVGFDPQFSNFCIDMGESAAAANAMQLAFAGKNTRFGFGHQGGTSFYAFDGNWYVFAQQNICKNVSVTGGVDFAENKTGFAAAKWADQNNALTVTGNKLGSEKQNWIVSYKRNNVAVVRNFVMSLGAAFWKQTEQTGLHLAAAFAKENFIFFTEAGGRLAMNTLTPTAGVGISYKF